MLNITKGLIEFADLISDLLISGSINIALPQQEWIFIAIPLVLKSQHQDCMYMVDIERKWSGGLSVTPALVFLVFSSTLNAL